MTDTSHSAPDSSGPAEPDRPSSTSDQPATAYPGRMSEENATTADAEASNAAQPHNHGETPTGAAGQATAQTPPNLEKPRPYPAGPVPGDAAQESGSEQAYPSTPTPHQDPSSQGPQGTSLEYPQSAQPGVSPSGGTQPLTTEYEQQPSYGPPGTAPQPKQRTYGYQAATGTPAPLDVGHALSYGWEKLRRNTGPWIAATALGLLIYLLFLVTIRMTEPTTMLPLILIFLAVMVGVWLLQAALIRGALYETDGYRPAFGSYFHLSNIGNVLLTAMLAFLATSIASAFCLLPGIAVGVCCVFSLHFVIDQNEGPFEAIRSSTMLVLANPVQVGLLVTAVILMTFVGALLCGFGLLAAGPVSAIAVTYAYRTLTGGPVADI